MLGGVGLGEGSWGEREVLRYCDEGSGAFMVVWGVCEVVGFREILERFGRERFRGILQCCGSGSGGCWGVWGSMGLCRIVPNGKLWRILIWFEQVGVLIWIGVSGLYVAF